MGLGTKILQALEAAAIRQGITMLELQSSLPAEVFYANHGYQVVGSDVLKSGNAVFSHVKMHKRL